MNSLAEMQKTEATAQDLELTPTPKRRRQSTVSEKSTNPLTSYDSGHYSSSSNAGDDCLDGSHQADIRAKEQALFLALQDVRKLRSELERLNKSEQWYKNELRQQKHTRLEALERLYTQERKYMQENQRLQRECVRLYGKCGDMELELDAQRIQALQQLEKPVAPSADSVTTSCTFELEQQQALIADQQQLIAVLRKQKRALLEELKQLAEHKDNKLLELQRTLASIELENTLVTSKCKTLLEERQSLVDKLRNEETNVSAQNVEREKLQKLIADLREQLYSQQQLLELKEREINELQQQFKVNLHDETNVDEVHRLSVVYHKEINAKSLEISSLKNALLQLQEELSVLADLQTQCEQQARQIEHLSFSLETRQFELEQLQQLDAEKAAQIAELQLNSEQLQSERACTAEQLTTSQITLKSLTKELIALNEQYASMCALCERTKFDLEIAEIEQGKLKFQAEIEEEEIKQLRAKLREYLQQTADLSTKIIALESELALKTKEKQELHNNLKSIEAQLEKERERCKSTQELLATNNEDMQYVQDKLLLYKAEVLDVTRESKLQTKQETEELKIQLEEHKATIIELRQENTKVKQMLVDNCKEQNLGLKSDNAIEEQFKNKEQQNSKISEQYKWTTFTKNKAKDVQNIELLTNDSYTLDEEMQSTSGKYVKAEKDGFKLKVKEQVENLGQQEEDSCSGLIKKQQIELEDKLKIVEHFKQENVKLKRELLDSRQENNEEFDCTAREDLQSLTNENSKLLNSLHMQNQILNENFATISEFEQIINSSIAIQNDLKTAENSPENLTIKLKACVVSMTELVKENQKCKAELSEEKHNKPATLQLQQKLQEKSQECLELKERLDKRNKDLQSLQRKLLANDSKLYKMEKTHQYNADIEENLTAALRSENQKLNKDLEVAKQLTITLQSKLSDECANVATLKAELSKAEAQQIACRQTEIETYKEKLQDYANLLENEQNMLLYIQSNTQLYANLAEHFRESEKTVKLHETVEQKIEEHKVTKLEVKIEDKTTTAESAVANFSIETDERELSCLREKVQDLQDQLKQALSSTNDNENHNERIQLMKKLLTQQTDRVEQLNEAHAEWEELLEALNIAQKIEENTRNELANKSQEFEELNALFNEQNEELQMLQHHSKLANFEQSTDNIELSETFQEQLSAMQEQLSAKTKECKEQTSIIVSLERENQRLKTNLNEDFVYEVTENKKQVRVLHAKIEKLQAEREESTACLNDMSKELAELKQSKRAAVALPELLLYHDNSLEIANKAMLDYENVVEEEEQRSTDESSDAASCYMDDRLRILTRVLESEHKRKMRRYDVHIRTLLSNVKSLKIALRAAEERAQQTGQKQTPQEIQLDLQRSSRQVAEYRLKYEQSQSKIKALEESLQLQRQKYEASDNGKAKQQQQLESTHEVANLIDDYKKLIQQSAMATQRPKTSAILDLIQRSNQCVPNLQQLESSVADLHCDIQQFIVNYAQRTANGPVTQKVPSLMDELRAATEHF